jgi:hypothetical protein
MGVEGPEIDLLEAGEMHRATLKRGEGVASDRLGMKACPQPGCAPNQHVVHRICP